MSYLSEMKGRITSWMTAAADFLLPRVCIVCGGRLLRAERHICLNCLADLPQTRFWTMEHNPMADRFNDVIQKDLETTGTRISGRYRPADMGIRERYARSAALFTYNEDNGYRKITQQVKYHGNLAAGRYFGSMLGRKLASSELFLDVDLVIPVPLHRIRQWKRGYNQAEVIAGEVARELGADMNSRILFRRRRTKTQTKLGTEEKAANVAGAFEALNGHISVRHILLIDDVFTTGSTAAACFHALREVFPPTVRISVATLAFVGEA